MGADATCEGPDEDEDGVPDACDVCPERDDEADGDGDGYPCNRDCDDDEAAINPEAVEVCDGVDNDCSGTPDDGLEGPAAARQDGVCAGARQRCDGGAWLEPDYAAIDGYEADEALCDGRDNDCDGATDEDLAAPPASRADGVCAGAVQQCGGGAGWAEPDYGAIAGYEADETLCDGLDNDCDGQVDEIGDAPPAARQQGVCAGSAKACAPGGGFVEPDYGAIDGYEANETLCDGLDNDCDGEIDANLAAPPAMRQAGVCVGARQVCSGAGGWVEPAYEAIAAFQADEARCDGLDNDCDGETDEGLDVGAACAAPGECGAGVRECAGPDATRCSTEPGGSADASAAERCDRRDNDCDGEVDDGVPCPPPGTPDARFGANGVAVIDVGVDAEASAVAVDADGRAVIAGDRRVAGTDLDFLVARLNRAGALDDTFGGGGVASHDFGGGPDRGFALVLAADGAPLVVGYGSVGGQPRPAALRLTAAGAPDAGFGGGGSLVVGAASGAWRGVAWRGGGGFAAAGDIRAAGSSAEPYLALFAAGGAPESSGTFPRMPGEDGHIRGLATDVDGRFYLGGHVERGYDDDHLVLRLGAGGAQLSSTERDWTDGRGDGTPGHAADSRDPVLAVGVDAQGRLVTAGASGGDMLIARDGADGQPDATFGGGHVRVDFQGGRDAAHAVAVQPDGAVLVAGRAEIGGVYRFAVARLTPDGALDPTFGGNGRLTLAIEAAADAVANGIALVPGEPTLVAVGRVGVGPARRVVVVRLIR